MFLAYLVTLQACPAAPEAVWPAAGSEPGLSVCMPCSLTSTEAARKGHEGFTAPSPTPHPGSRSQPGTLLKARHSAARHLATGQRPHMLPSSFPPTPTLDAWQGKLHRPSW